MAIAYSSVFIALELHTGISVGIEQSGYNSPSSPLVMKLEDGASSAREFFARRILLKS